MTVRIKFSKKGNIRFVGHLDLMRTLQKVFRKAGVPIAYSEGFNPHQIFSIAAPLALGITSDAEYLDMKLASEIETETLKEMINKACPEGIEILNINKLKPEEPAGMALVCASKYVITQNDVIITNENVAKLMERDNIIIKKKNKKGKIIELDIKPGIYNLNVQDCRIVMTIATGSKLNVKPEFVLKAICEQAEIAYNPFDFTLHREEIYHTEKALISFDIPKFN